MENIKDYYDIIIIGGSAAGFTALKSCSNLYGDKSILVIKKDNGTPISCAIPYVYEEIGNCEKNLIPNEMIGKIGGDLLIREVDLIDTENKKLKIKDFNDIYYDKLIITTGSLPIKPPIKNIDLDFVEFIYKNSDSVNNMVDKIHQSNEIVIIGGGYIGVEFAEQIKEMTPNKNITIIEGLDRCLATTFDEEFSNEVEDKLRFVGINIIKSKFVSELIGENKIEKVILNDGFELNADLVIVGVGARPNTELAEKSGIKLTEHKEILVDRFQRTMNKDIFSAGDCASKFSFITHKPSPIKLSSIATMEARILSENLYANNFSNKGVIGTYSTKVHEKIYSGVGFTENFAKKEGFDIIIGRAKVMNRHPDSLKDANEINLKLIFNKKNKELLGAQISGSVEVGEIINQISVIIENKMKIHDIIFLQPATHPKVTASPVKYPIILAAEDALNKMN